MPASAAEWTLLDREALIALNPDVVLWIKDAPPEAAGPYQKELEEAFAGLPIAASKNNRLRVIADPRIMVPSANLPQLVGLLGDAIFGVPSEAQPGARTPSSAQTPPPPN